jgi:hypothetical protein
MSYAEQLRDVRWQKVRLKCLEAASWKCQQCGSDDKQLHVHHRVYVRGRKAWEYDEHELSVLCDRHHEIEHAAKDLLESMILAVGDAATHQQLCAMVGGFLWSQYRIEDNAAKSCRSVAPMFFDDAAQGRRFGMSPEHFQRRLAAMGAT